MLWEYIWWFDFFVCFLWKECWLLDVSGWRLSTSRRRAYSVEWCIFLIFWCWCLSCLWWMWVECFWIYWFSFVVFFWLNLVSWVCLSFLIIDWCIEWFLIFIVLSVCEWWDGFCVCLIYWLFFCLLVLFWVLDINLLVFWFGMLNFFLIILKRFIAFICNTSRRTSLFFDFNCMKIWGFVIVCEIFWCLFLLCFLDVFWFWLCIVLLVI